MMDKKMFEFLLLKNLPHPLQDQFDHINKSNGIDFSKDFKRNITFMDIFKKIQTIIDYG